MIDSRLRRHPVTFRVLSRSNFRLSEVSVVKTITSANTSDRFVAVAPTGATAGTFVVAATVSKH